MLSRVVRSSIVVYDVEGKILVVKEHMTPQKTGFPKGYIYPGENIWLSACRHLEEDTGIDLRCTRFRRLNRFPILMDIPHQQVMAFFKVQLLEVPFQTQRPKKSATISWETKDELIDQTRDQKQCYNLPMRKFVGKL